MIEIIGTPPTFASSTDCTVKQAFVSLRNEAKRGRGRGEGRESEDAKEHMLSEQHSRVVLGSLS